MSETARVAHPARTPAQLREATGLGLPQAAAASGVSEATIRRVEAGRDVTLRILGLLAAAYGCTRSDLLAGIERVRAEPADGHQ